MTGPVTNPYRLQFYEPDRTTMLPSKLIEAREQSRITLNNYDTERSRQRDYPSEAYALDYAAPIVEALRMLYVLSAPTPREVIVEALGMLTLSRPSTTLDVADATMTADFVAEQLAKHGYKYTLDGEATT